MPSTLICVETEKGFDCKMITDGKIEENWTVSKIDLTSEKDKRIDIFVDLDKKTMVASTSDYLTCEKKGESLVCSGTRGAGRGRGKWEVFEKL